MEMQRFKGKLTYERCCKLKLTYVRTVCPDFLQEVQDSGE